MKKIGLAAVVLMFVVSPFTAQSAEKQIKLMEPFAIFIRKNIIMACYLLSLLPANICKHRGAGLVFHRCSRTCG